MMYLDRLAEIIAAKRTKTQEKKDKTLLKRLMQEKAAKDDVRKAREETKKPEKVAPKKADPKVEKVEKEETPAPEKVKSPEKQAPLSTDSAVVKLEKMKKPSLFLINANILMHNTDKKAAQQAFQAFLKDKDVDEDAGGTGISIKEILNQSISLSNKDGFHAWICDGQFLQPLGHVAFANELEHFPNKNQVTTIFDVADPKPFKMMPLGDLEGVTVQSELRRTLHEAWSPIAAEMAAKKEKEPEAKEEKETPPEKAPETEETEPTEEEQTDEDTTDEEEEEEEEDQDVSDEDLDKSLATGRSPTIDNLRSLRDPYVFALDPRARLDAYVNFVGPDKPGETPKASKVLPEAIRFLVSKKVQKEGHPLLVYFMSAALVNKLKVELKAVSKPNFYLNPIDKNIFNKDDPFFDFQLKQGSKVVSIQELGGDPLVLEMNKTLTGLKTKTSGNPMPAIQASSYIPVNFFRFLSKKQRPVELYIGDRPEGAGSEDSVYALTENDAEGTHFVSMFLKFKMPTMFYDNFSNLNDIEAAFKDIDPEKITPANALILYAKDSFKPKEKVDISKDWIEKHKDLLGNKDGLTQLELLHNFARFKLGNPTVNPGTLVSSKRTIGTTVAQFNASMTVCFLWGSHSKHIAIDVDETLDQLPFVEKVITDYL